MTPEKMQTATKNKPPMLKQKLHTGALFLDFDGPISTSRAFLSNQSPEKLNSAPATHGYSSKESSRDDGMLWLDETSCRMVNLLCVEFDLEIIISSTWRKLYEIAALRDMLLLKGGISPQRVTGITPILPCATRGKEILQSLESRPDINVYLILDDDMFDIEPFHGAIHRQKTCDFDSGITSKEFLQAKSKLAQQISQLTDDS